MTVEELRVVISAEFAGLKASIKNSKKSLKSVEKAAESVQEKLQNAFNIHTNTIEKSFDNISKQTAEFKKSFGEITGVVAATQAQLSSFNKDFTFTGLSRDVNGLESQFNQIKEFVNEYSRLSFAKSDGKITSEEYARSLDELKEKYRSILELVNELHKKGMLDLELGVDSKDKDPILTPKFDEEKIKDYLKNYDLETYVKEAETKVKDTVENIGIIKDNLQFLNEEIKENQGNLKAANNELNQYNSKVEKINKKVAELSAKWYEMTAAMRDIGSQMGIDLTNTDMETAIPGLKELNEQIAALKQEYEELAPKQEQASEKVDRYKESLKQANQELERQKRLLANSKAILADTKNQLSQAQEELKNSQKVMKNIGSQTKKTSKLLSSFLMTAKFMAFSKMINLLTKDLGECFNLLMKFDNAKDNIYGYNMAVSDLTSAFKRMSAEIAIVFANIVSIIGPVLTQILDIFSNVIEGINALIAALQGKEKYIGVNKDYWKNYAESLEDATKAQKKFLAGFDELTVLQDNTTTTDKPEDLYVEKDVSTSLRDLGQELAAVLALVAGYEVLKNLIKVLSGLFGDKNKVLNTQTQLTQEETAAVGALQPAYALATSGALGLATALGAIKMPELATEPVTAISTALETTKTNSATQTEGIKSNLLSLMPVFAMVAASVPILSIIFDTSSVLPQLESVSQTVSTKLASLKEFLVTEGATILSGIGEWFTQLSPVIGSGYSQLLALQDSFTEQSKSGFSIWGLALSTTCSLVFGYLGSAAYEGLTKVGSLITEWAPQTYDMFKQWGQGVVDLFASIGTGIVITLVSALSAAITNIKNFANAIKTEAGEKVIDIGDFLADNGGKIAACVAIGGALALGAMTLAPATGIAVAIPALAALADGGVLTTPTPALVGEYPGAKRNPEIVTPQNIMRETMAEANDDVVNAIYAIGNQLTKTIEDKDTNVYMDSAKVTRKITKTQKEQAKYSSGSLVLI